MFIRSSFILGLLALFLTACAMADMTGKATDRLPLPSGPNRDWQCVLDVAQTPDSVVFDARIAADTQVSGSYVLQIRQIAGDSAVDQSGDFSVGDGQTQSLGSADLGGAPGDYAADLTVTVADKAVTCPTRIAP